VICSLALLQLQGCNAPLQINQCAILGACAMGWKTLVYGDTFSYSVCLIYGVMMFTAAANLELADDATA